MILLLYLDHKSLQLEKKLVTFSSLTRLLSKSDQKAIMPRYLEEQQVWEKMADNT